VIDLEQIQRTEAATEDESQVVPQWCDQHQFRSIVFVAARDHSRRVRHMLIRIMKGHPIHVKAQLTRYSSFDPD
jgi:hypothetical protein